jgi:predicted nucleic acid-binding protein
LGCGGVSSALSIKIRTGHLSVADRAKALMQFKRLQAESLDTWVVDAAHFRTAARFAAQYELGLRAADALHLAICADFGACLCTLDKRLAEAAQVLGVAAVMP